MTARVRSPTAASSCATIGPYVPGSTSTNTGTSPFWTIGLTVVGNPAATVSTSSPGFSRASPSEGEVRHDSARRFADEPEFTSIACRACITRAKRRSKSIAKRPAVSQKSSPASTTCCTSSAPNTFPETGTADSPGTNSRGAKATSWYSATRSRICRRSSSALRGMGDRQKVAIPRHGALESRVELEARRPVEQAARLRRAQVLVLDLVRRLVADIGLERRAHLRQNVANEIEHGHLNLVREVEALAGELGARTQRFGEAHVRPDAVLDVEVVAHERAVGADDRALAVQHRPNGAGHEPIPVQVPTAIEIAAAGDRHGQAVRHRVAMGDQVRAGLAHVVRMLALERSALVVGELLLVAVGLVAARDDDGLHPRRPAARLEQRPRSLNVRLEGGDGISLRHADDRLCREMEHGVHLVLAQHALQKRLIANVAADRPHPSERAAPHELTLRYPVAHQTHDVGAFGDQSRREPAAEQAGGAGDEGWTVSPEPRSRHSHTFHGASPLCHIDSRRLRSRTVSI